MIDLMEIDNLFVLIFVNYINNDLYDNNDSYLILNYFFNSNESILEYELFSPQLENKIFFYKLSFSIYC